MGKPFAKELEKINETRNWGFTQDSGEIRKELLSMEHSEPLYVVGSGGSLSACYFAAMLYQQHGHMAKAVPPLELFYSRATLRTSKVLFISASGRNNDILFGYKSAISFEPRSLFSLTMKIDSPLGRLSRENNLGKHFEFNLPAGKDGFLATNSLMGFFSILYSALSKTKNVIPSVLQSDTKFFDDLDTFINSVSSDHTFTVLYAGWGQPVAMDLESKLAEAALANVLISDVRNFGHGRHHWFAKRKKSSAIIALITPEEEKITAKTLSLLPPDIPVLKIRSSYTDGMASIDMLEKSFHFVSRLGALQDIDPGRPGVPDFGSKLYHLKYGNFYKINNRSEVSDKHIAILRKTKLTALDQLGQLEREFWLDSYDRFTNGLRNTVFGSIVFDYDGTLCSLENRFTGISEETVSYLQDLLKNNIVIGVATGRGGSVGEDLRKKINKEYWCMIFIGYYNCSEIAVLEDKSAPNKNREPSQVLKMVYEKIVAYNFGAQIKSDIRPSQIIIKMVDVTSWSFIRSSIIQFVHALSIKEIQVLESSHSIDIIESNISNKLNIIQKCVKKAISMGASSEFLCIGDKGKWPGNDYQLLSHPFSLSVDEVSALPDSCWNLARPGLRNIEALHQYLSLIRYHGQNFKLEL